MEGKLIDWEEKSAQILTCDLVCTRGKSIQSLWASVSPSLKRGKIRTNAQKVIIRVASWEGHWGQG